MKTEMPGSAMHGRLMIGYAKASDVVGPSIATLLIFGFYMAHYAWSTGFFTDGFTPLLATLFYASVLYTVVNAAVKAITPDKVTRALVELLGSALFAVVAAWFFVAFPLNFAHVADVVPASAQFLLTWLTNDVGRILVAIVFAASIIALGVNAFRLAWRLLARPIFHPD